MEHQSVLATHKQTHLALITVIQETNFTLIFLYLGCRFYKCQQTCKFSFRKRQQRHKDSGRTFVMALVGEKVPWPTELIDEGDEGYVVFCRSDDAL